MSELKKILSNYRSSFIIVSVALVLLITAATVILALTQRDNNISGRDTVITNITDTAFTVTWVSDDPYIGRIVYQEGEIWRPMFAQHGLAFAWDDRDVELNELGEYVEVREGAKERYTHHVTIKNLKPDTVYSFRIGGSINGKAMSASVTKTRKIIEGLNAPDPAYGQIENLNTEDSIIIVGDKTDTSETALLISSPVSANSTYSIDAKFFERENIQGNELYAIVRNEDNIIFQHNYNSEGYKPLNTIVVSDATVSQQQYKTIGLGIIEVVNAEGSCAGGANEFIVPEGFPTNDCFYDDPATTNIENQIDNSQRLSIRPECRATSTGADTRNWCLVLRSGVPNPSQQLGPIAPITPTQPVVSANFNCGGLGNVSSYRANQGINIRQNASTLQSRVGGIDAGQTISGCSQYVSGEIVSGNDDRWVKVNYNGGDAYIYAQLLTLEEETTVVGTNSTTSREPVIEPESNVIDSAINNHTGDSYTIDAATNSPFRETAVVRILPSTSRRSVSFNYSNKLLEGRDTTEYLAKLSQSVRRPLSGGYPTYAVLHWTGVDQSNCEGSVYNTFAPPFRDYNGSTGPNLCTNYSVNKDGSGVQFVPVGNACINAGNGFLNSGLAVSFENCGSAGLGISLTNEQVLSNAFKIAQLIDNNQVSPSICILGHYDSAQKSDSGPEFVRAVYNQLKEWDYSSVLSSADRSCSAPDDVSASVVDIDKNQASEYGMSLLPRIAAESGKARSGYFTLSDKNASQSYQYYIDENVSTIYIDENLNGIFDEGEEVIDRDSLSLNEEALQYSLQEGWNLISIPMLDTNYSDSSFIAQDILDAGATVVHVAKFTSGKFIIDSYRAGEVNISNKFNLTPGEGIFVFTNIRKTMEIKGKRITSPNPIVLENGWNLVGFSGYDSLTTDSVFDSANAKNLQLTTISQFENGIYSSVVQDEDTRFGNSFNIVDKRGYFIRVESFDEQLFTP
jgi:hypothetical protein